MSARLFDYGAVSISMDIPIHPGTDLADLLPLCDELYESRDLDACALKEVDALLERIAAAVEHPHGWRVPETYTIVFLEQLAEPLRGQELLAWPPLAKLLVGEQSPRPFSAQQTADVLEHAHSYFDDDLVVVDWNSALVLEPTGNREICDILELATSQLLELRYYDGLLDKELARIYDRLERAGRELALFRSPYMKVAREAERRIVELTEFTERVDNSLKIIGDFYLARVYDGAVRRFRIGGWRASIDGKQALIAQAYGLIRAEIDARRSTVLELVVIILILTEIVLAFFRR